MTPIEPIEPPRLEDGDNAVLRELMRRRRRGPSATSVEKITQRLAAAGIMASAPIPETRLGLLRAASYKIGGVALLLTTGLFVVWESAHSSAPPADTSASTSIGTSASMPAATGAEIVAAAPATTANSPAIIPTTDSPGERAAPRSTGAAGERGVASSISVNKLPSAVPPAETGPKRSPSSGSASPGTTSAAERRAVPSANELDLVQRAEAALATDPQRALSIASEHARTFPSGEFLQEREVIAIDALARLGRKDESLRRARALVQRFPQTPYAARVELAVGERLTP